MNYEYEEAPDKNLGWLSLAISAGTLAFNYLKGTVDARKANNAAQAAIAQAQRDQTESQKRDAAIEAEKQKVITAVKKSLPVIGIILVASVLGGVVGGKKK